MTRVLQGNLHRCEAAQLLLHQIATERDTDVLILSEQYRNEQTQAWFSNTTGTSAIWVRGANATRVLAADAGEDYTYFRIGDITYVSVYLTPNCTDSEFELKVGKFEDALRDLPGDLVIAGNMNSRVIEWGMPTTDKRERLLLEMAARLGLAVANTGQTPTYRRPEFGYSIPDVTMVTDSILQRIGRWRVIKDFTASDHQHIAFEVAGRTRTQHDKRTQLYGWNLKRLNMGRFSEVLLSAVAPS